MSTTQTTHISEVTSKYVFGYDHFIFVRIARGELDKTPQGSFYGTTKITSFAQATDRNLLADISTTTEDDTTEQPATNVFVNEADSNPMQVKPIELAEARKEVKYNI
jgi:hypothetical protein